jgi:hypothetical protein
MQRSSRFSEYTYSRPEIFAFPLLDGGFRLEVTEILQIQSLVLAIEFHRSLFTTLDDGVDIVIHHYPGQGYKKTDYFHDTLTLR